MMSLDTQKSPVPVPAPQSGNADLAAGVPVGSQQQIVHIHSDVPVFKDGRITREGAINVLKSGGSVLLNRGVERDAATGEIRQIDPRHVKSMAELPGPDYFAQTPEDRTKARQALEAEQKRLSDQLAALDAEEKPATSPVAEAETPKRGKPAAK